jgi:hypothetical protein
LLQQPVNQGGLAMVDVSDDGDIAKVHRCSEESGVVARECDVLLRCI